MTSSRWRSPSRVTCVVSAACVRSRSSRQSRIRCSTWRWTVASTSASCAPASRSRSITTARRSAAIRRSSSAKAESESARRAAQQTLELRRSQLDFGGDQLVEADPGLGDRAVDVLRALGALAQRDPADDREDESAEEDRTGDSELHRRRMVLRRGRRARLPPGTRSPAPARAVPARAPAGASPARCLLDRPVGVDDRSVDGGDASANGPHLRGQSALREAEEERCRSRRAPPRRSMRSAVTEVARQDREGAPGEAEPEVGVEAAAEELEVVGGNEERSDRDEREQPRPPGEGRGRRRSRPRRRARQRRARSATRLRDRRAAAAGRRSSSSACAATPSARKNAASAASSRSTWSVGASAQPIAT